MISWNKMGTEEASLSFFVGIIIAILLGSTILIVVIQWYQTTTKAEQSFDALVNTIVTVEDKEKGSMAFSLPKNNILVSFKNGQDHPEEGDCDEAVDVPTSCGTVPCICLCSTRVSEYEDACTKNSVECYAFTEQKEYMFSDALCDGGSLYREGASNGIFTLFYEKEGNTIKLCDGSCEKPAS